MYGKKQQQQQQQPQQLGHSTSKHDIKPNYNNSMAKTIQLALFASPFFVFAGMRCMCHGYHICVD